MDAVCALKWLYRAGEQFIIFPVKAARQWRTHQEDRLEGHIAGNGAK
jgi:hypothetical protein